MTFSLPSTLASKGCRAILACLTAFATFAPAARADLLDELLAPRPIEACAVATINGTGPGKPAIRPGGIANKTANSGAALPLDSVFYSRNTYPVTTSTSGGQNTHSLRIAIPGWDASVLVWQLLFESVDDADTARVQALRSALDSRTTTQITVRFEDNHQGEAAFVGVPSAGAEPEGFDRVGAQDILLHPRQNLCGQTDLYAVAFVSAPELGIVDLPLFLGGTVETAYTYTQTGSTASVGAIPARPEKLTGTQVGSQATQPTGTTNQPQQQLPPPPAPPPVPAGCQSSGGNCVPNPPGGVCQVLVPVIDYVLVCNGKICATYPSYPTGIDLSGNANCKLYIRRTNQWGPGSCNWVRPNPILLPWYKLCKCA